MGLFGLGLNPIQDIGVIGQGIGGVFGNAGPGTAATTNTFTGTNLGNGGTIQQATPGNGTGTYTIGGVPQTGSGAMFGDAATQAAQSPQPGGTVQVDPATQQAINNIQSAIDRTGSQQDAGNASLDTQYNNALQSLLLGYNQSQGQYQQGQQTNATGYVGNKNTIGANAGSTLNGLLRLLGSRGAGGGSAYNTAAPQAVTRGATLQRADASNNFAQNAQNLDTGWGNYLTGYNNQVTGVGAQRDQGKQTLASNIANNKAQLLQTLAGLQGTPGAAQPYLDQANSLLDQSANYQTPQINYQTQAYTPPSLASYTPTPQTAPGVQNASTGSDYFSPYLSSLLGKKQPAIA